MSFREHANLWASVVALSNVCCAMIGMEGLYFIGGMGVFHGIYGVRRHEIKLV